MSFLAIYLVSSVVFTLFLLSILLILKDNYNKNLSDTVIYTVVYGLGILLLPFWPLTSFVNIFILVASLLLLNVNAFGYMFWGWSLIAFSNIGLILMYNSENLIGLYLGLELYSLSAYILASGKVTSKDTSVGEGISYFLISVISSGVFLVGICIIYSCTGTLDLRVLERIFYFLNFSSYRFLIIGTIALISTLSFKIGSAPFHFWVAPLYSKISFFVLFYFILVPKICIIFTTIKIALIFKTTHLFLFISFLALSSLIYGAIGGINQIMLIRLIAYSSISHVGYIYAGLYGVLCGLCNDTPHINNTIYMYSFYLYIIIYIISICSFFLIIKNYTVNNILDKYLSNLKNIYNTNKYLSASLAIVVLSMGGIPPLAGFSAKLSIYYSLLDNGAYIMCIFAVICSIVSTTYYLKFIKISYFYKTDIQNSIEKTKPFCGENALIISFCTMCLIFYPILSPKWDLCSTLI